MMKPVTVELYEHRFGQEGEDDCYEAYLGLTPDEATAFTAVIWAMWEAALDAFGEDNTRTDPPSNVGRTDELITKLMKALAERISHTDEPPKRQRWAKNWLRAVLRFATALRVTGAAVAHAEPPRPSNSPPSLASWTAAAPCGGAERSRLDRLVEGQFRVTGGIGRV